MLGGLGGPKNPGGLPKSWRVPPFTFQKGLARPRISRHLTCRNGHVPLWDRFQSVSNLRFEVGLMPVEAPKVPQPALNRRQQEGLKPSEVDPMAAHVHSGT